MLANSGRSRLTSSGSGWDLAGLLCVGLAMRAGAAGVRLAKLLLRCFLDEGVIVTVATVQEGALFYVCR
jgi:hypothetical protein